MKNPPWLEVEPYRLPDRPGYRSQFGDPYGFFLIPFPKTGTKLRVIATDGDYQAAGLGEEYAWEHVSVSLANRCPNWLEMDFICRLFWRDDETVMQLHVPRACHRNFHPFCLHLWRPKRQKIPRPPNDAVALKEGGPS